MDKQSHAQYYSEVLNETPFPNFNSCTIDFISSWTLLDMWLLIHAEIQVNPC